jgi:hypothetical protein
LEQPGRGADILVEEPVRREVDELVEEHLQREAADWKARLQRGREGWLEELFAAGWAGRTEAPAFLEWGPGREEGGPSQPRREEVQLLDQEAMHQYWHC